MRRTFLLLLVIILIRIGTASAHAEVVLDGTMGTAGALKGPAYDIPAGYGQQAGANLFHSFQTFSINAKESATFTGPSSIQNVISRVTGGSLSRIDGKLSCTIADANFYFLNPAGVIFGATASSDLGGSFHVSTADYLRLGNNERFYAAPMAGEVLSSAAPSAFGFLKDSPAPMTFEAKGNVSQPVSISEGKAGDIDASAFAGIRKTADMKASDETGRGVFIRAEQFVANIKVTEVSISRFMRLPQNFMEVSEWVTTPCALRSGKKANRLVIRGRDAVAASFDDWQPSPLMWLTDSALSIGPSAFSEKISLSDADCSTCRKCQE